MNSKSNSSKKDSNTTRLSEQEKMNIKDSKIKTNPQKDNRQYNVQLVILEEIKKLKVNLEITDKHKFKSFYITTISLSELISLNSFFNKFRDYSEAFDYLLKNFTKIDGTKITYLNNNKEIKILLLFSTSDISKNNNNDIIEEGIELVLRHYNINTNKSITVINNLKGALEEFNLSINQIKLNINNDKIETEKRIIELEKYVNKKLSEMKNDGKIKKTNNNKSIVCHKGKLDEIITRLEEYDNEINTLKNNIEDRYTKQKNEINKNNKIFFEMESELSQLIMDKFEDFINKINNLDAKSVEIENNFYNKISDLDKKTNICFNELIKKINKKNNGFYISENDLKIKLNGIIGRIVEDNENSDKKLENRINQKIEDLKILINEKLMKKINLYDEKLMIKENNNQDNFNEEKKNKKDNQLFKDKMKYLEDKINQLEKINDFNEKRNDDLEKYIKNIEKNLEKKEISINDINIKIIDKDHKIKQLFEELNIRSKEAKGKSNNNIDKDNIKDDFKEINSEMKNSINPKIIDIEKKLEKNIKLNTIKEKKKNYIENKNIMMDEINNTRDENDRNKKEMNTNIENKIKEMNKQIQELKKELYSKLNKINDYQKEDIKEINNKVLLLKTEILKIIDNKNIIIENKIKLLDGKFKYYENIINIIRKDSQMYIDKINIMEKTNKFNSDANNIKVLDTNLTSSNLKIKDMDNKVRQLDKIIDFNNIKDSYSTKALINSNSNGNLIRNNKIALYGNNTPNTYNLNINDIQEKNLKKKRYSNYNLSNNLKNNKTKEKINHFDLSIDTNILKNDELNENFFLFNKLKEIYPHNRYLKLILIYRASRDGDLAKDFHLQCDFIGPNVTLVKTKRGYIFGGFTVKSWKHLYKDIKKDDPENGTEYKDIKAFGFSVNKKKIYENGIPDEEIIYCNNNYGVCFKNYFFKIFDGCFKNGGVCGKIEEINFDGIDKEYEFNGGEKKFDIEEIEVFQIGFR